MGKFDTPQKKFTFGSLAAARRGKPEGRYRLYHVKQSPEAWVWARTRIEALGRWASAAKFEADVVEALGEN